MEIDKKEFDVDFVIPWVDGSDKKWIDEFNQFCPYDKRIDVSVIRYRDNGLLRYWFRGCEKYAPWVRKVHFITCGQTPEWLNINNPKLNLVKHSDYIPKEFLPVFSSHPIELMMHKIPDLSENFVYFNDDFFLTSPVKKNFFFKRNLPCDTAILNIIPCTDIMGHIVLNNLDIINKYYKTRSVVNKNFIKWFNIRNGYLNLRTLTLLPWSRFSGFYDHHFAQPYKKTIFEEVWEKNTDVLNSTMKSKFRNISDVNQWVFRYWQLCSGNFTPTTLKDKHFFSLSDDINEIVAAIRKQKYSEIVINDSQEVENYEKKINDIRDSFNSILPEKSKFEI